MTAKTGAGIRIDRWLWCARFNKTRSQASVAIQGGHVRINDVRARPGSRVTPGDRLRIVREGLEYELVVLSLPTRRGPAAEAQACYAEDEASRQRREATVEKIRMDRRLMPRTDGRPDKHTQRKIRRFNRDSQDE
jgi:ribosome-associated heat shock protein Hsp15